MAVIDLVDDLRVVEREALASYLAAIGRAEEAGKLNEPENFAQALRMALHTIGLPATELARDEQISPAAISKWINGHAAPSAPVRKTVINWIKQKGEERLNKLPGR
jgi:hypothetical protein